MSDHSLFAYIQKCRDKKKRALKGDRISDQDARPVLFSMEEMHLIGFQTEIGGSQSI